MKKKVVMAILIVAVPIAAVSYIKLKKEYAEMEKRENELKNHPLYRMKKEAVRFTQKKDMKTISVPDNASLKSRLLACLEILK